MDSRTALKKTVWDKTGGRCHICGRVLVFDARPGAWGRWHLDHIVPLSKGGKSRAQNYLPICAGCNRLKWDHKGLHLQLILRYGVWATAAVRRKTELGKALAKYFRQMAAQIKRRNEKRHRSKR
jgi:5-methylcytosine-specific restriction endonuclease McrA